MVNCPLCVDESLEARRHGGIEIDVCPRCRGIWLDRGELERLAASPEPPAREPSPRADRDRDRDDRGRDRYDDDRRDRPRRKKSFSERLGDVLGDVIDL